MQRAIIVALAVVVLCAVAGAFVLKNLALSIFAVVSLLFLVVTATGSARIPSSCAHLTGRAGSLRIWGNTPPQIGDVDVIVQRVWALGAGVHFRVSAPGKRSSTHIKVAQSARWRVDQSSLTIEDARYVQVSGATIERNPSSPALQFAIR